MIKKSKHFETLAHLPHCDIIKLSICTEIKLFLCRCDLERGVYENFKKGFSC